MFNDSLECLCHKTWREMWGPEEEKCQFIWTKWVKGTGRATRKQAGSLKSYCISLLLLAPTSGSRSSRTVSSCFSSVSDRLPRSSSSSRSLYSPKSFRNGSAMARTVGSHVIGLLLIAVEGRNNHLNVSFISLHLWLGKGKCHVHRHTFFIISSLLFPSDNSCLH